MKNLKGKRTILYRRVSTTEQKKTGNSLNSQKDKLSIQKKIKNQRQKEKFLNFIVFIIAIILAIILYPIIAAPFLNVL